MNRANKVEQYLDRLNIAYQVVNHDVTQTLEDAAEAGKVNLAQLARAVLLHDSEGAAVLAILPATHLLDFSAIREHIGRDLSPAPTHVIRAAFPGCEPGSIPPIEKMFGLRAIIDTSLAETDPVYFEPGCHDSLLRLSGANFQLLHAGCIQAAIGQHRAHLHSDSPSEFIVPEEFRKTHDLKRLRPAGDIKKQILNLDKIPPMPEMATSLLRLRNNPHANIEQLAEIVATDPSLAAQVMRYARSAFFGYRGKIESIHDAISRVLGFDTVMNMSLGLAASRSLRTPPDGPLGLRAFWRHATFSAALAQALCPLLPFNLEIKPGIAYLAGLLHNFGFLLEGHVIKNEFFLLNKIVDANPDVPVTLIERRVLGIDHTEVGAWLMEAWNLPDEVVVSIREHHNLQYNGEHAAYANLILLTDQLLKGRGIGDGSSTELPAEIITALALDRNAVLEVTDRIMAEEDDLETMAQQLCA